MDLYYGLQFTYSSMQRTTDMLNGRAWYLARLGEENNYHYYYLADAADEVLAAGDDLSQLPHRLVGYAHHFVDPAVKAGMTYKKISVDTGLSVATISRLSKTLKQKPPKEKPWETLGISKSTYYRKKKSL